MRVLLLHNHYRAAGGEERAVADLTWLLEMRGDHVYRIDRSSADAGRVRAARGLLAGGLAPHEIAATVRRRRIDVVHAHNIHPLLGWRALAAASEAGARTVLHVHNFRLFCAIGVAYRDGEPCFRCRGQNMRPGLRLRCRGSLPESAVYAAALRRQQPLIFEHTGCFAVVSQATAERLEQLGLPRGRTAVIPNFVRAGALAAASGASEGSYALLAGRLVPEKGYDTAIAACRETGVPLVVAGEGPDGPRLRALAAGANVRFTGRLAQDALARLRAGAAVALAPSRWEEPCPYAVLDALAAGVPVLVGDRGGLPELAPPEAVLDSESVATWAAALSELWRDPELRRARGEAGLALARERFGEDHHYAALRRCYQQA